MQIIQQLEATRDQTLQRFGLGAAELERTYAAGKWSVRFILHHLADTETVLSEPLELSRQMYEAVRNMTLYYAGRFYDTEGHREWVHSMTGVRTLKDEFDKVASHNAHHLSQIAAALAGTPWSAA